MTATLWVQLTNAETLKGHSDAKNFGAAMDKFLMRRRAGMIKRIFNYLSYIPYPK